MYLTIDLEKLLAPIGEDGPAGPDLRLDPGDVTLAKIKSLRRDLDPAFDDGRGSAANWPAVRRDCEQAIATVSKDLELAGWLTEALGRLEGFAGLREGLQLIRELLDRYWAELYPRADIEDGHELLTARARCLNWLSEKRGLLPSIEAIAFLGEGDRREQWLPWGAFLEAQRLEEASVAQPARYEEMVASGAVSMERWNAALAATPSARLIQEYEALRAAEAELRALDGLCTARFPADDVPSFIDLRGILSDIREWLEQRVPTADADTAAAAPPATAGAVTGSAISGGPIGSREQALARLREVADFFRRTEPHSPVSHLVDRAVRWGGMSFEEVLLDVVKKGEALTQIWETLGIKPPSAD